MTCDEVRGGAPTARLAIPVTLPDFCYTNVKMRAILKTLGLVWSVFEIPSRQLHFFQFPSIFLRSSEKSSLQHVQTRRRVEKLDHILSILTGKPTPQNIHRFRTSARRIEVVLASELALPHTGSRKTIKLLARLRRKAGRVRDLDVQIRMLRGLKMPEESKRKSELLRLFAEERAQRDDKLRKAFDRDKIRELRKRVKRIAREIPEDWKPLQEALSCIKELSASGAPLTEKTLHQYRILGKRARYLAELADGDPEAVHVVGALRKMQDVIGDWHDWLKLTERAEDRFGGSRDSHLVAALRNVTQAKFRQSLAAVEEARIELGGRKASAPRTVPGKKAQAETFLAAAAVA
jgi:CHAD domain-containing protein